MLGCNHLSSQRIEQHLTELERTFDAAVKAAKTTFFFSTDITPAARRIAIGGSRELIRAGCHREAVFWIVATFARCHKILETDSPARSSGISHPGISCYSGGPWHYFYRKTFTAEPRKSGNCCLYSGTLPGQS